MTRFIVEEDVVSVPNWVNDLESFRRWSDDDAFPETGRIAFLNGEVWVDMSKEQLFSHVRLKTVVASVLYHLTEENGLGSFFGDGAFVSNVEADISNQPDGMLVSDERLADGRIRAVEGKARGYVEFEGAPDMVLEVVSDSSAKKDGDILREAYAKAGIPEHWLIDARGDSVTFDVLRLGRKGYTAVRKRDGWGSEVFGRRLRLVQALCDDGYPEFTLEVTP